MRDLHWKTVLIAVAIAAVALPALWLVREVREVFVTDFGPSDQVEINCSEFEFDPEAWRRAAKEDPTGRVTDRERLAQGLLKCRTLDGLNRARVHAMLGRGSGRLGKEKYLVGWVNDQIGPGDGLSLTVRYDRDDRVVGAAYGAG